MSTSQTAQDTAELKRLTNTLIRVLNSRDFTYEDDDGKEILSHIAPDFEARFDTYPHALSFEQQTDIWRKDARDYPSLHFSVLDMTTQVRRRSQTASVFLSLALTGMKDVQYQGLCELIWRCRDDTWALYRHITMRGPLPDTFAS